MISNVNHETWNWIIHWKIYTGTVKRLLHRNWEFTVLYRNGNISFITEDTHCQFLYGRHNMRQTYCICGVYYYKLNLMDGFNIISDHIVRGHHLLSGMSNKKTNLDSCHFSRGALYEVFLTWIKLQVDKKRNIFDSNGNTGCLFEL